MPTVAISVDCEAANDGRAYTKEIIRVAEEFTVPLTWLIFVSEKDPLSNLDLYRNEFLHRIPSWHEIGLLVKFENHAGYIADPHDRGDVIRMAKDAVKSRHIKPTAFRAHGLDLLPEDLKVLEDIGILVDSSSCPGAKDKFGVVHAEGPHEPYHPSYSDTNAVGDAKIIVSPITTHKGVAAYLDQGWEKVRPVMEHSLARNAITHLALTDTMDDAETLHKALAYAKEAGATFITLTQIASAAG
ncbi:MAG: hypothetical protein ABJA67_09745 [Chthonomonadales bacterium]